MLPATRAPTGALGHDGVVAAHALEREQRPWLAAIGLYGTAVVVLQALAVRPAWSSPLGVVRGEVAELFLSGLFVAGGAAASALAVPALLVALAAAALVAGARRTIVAALAGHVGATLVVYGALGTLWLAGLHVWQHALDAPDYGISCVYAAALGLVAVRTRRVALRVAVFAAAVLSLSLGGDLTGWEHALALLSGVLVGRAGEGAARA